MLLRRRLALLGALALLTALALPALPAGAANPVLLTRIVKQIAAQTFDPCNYSPQQLQEALGSIPPDFDEYAPQIRPTLRAAIASRGSCGSPNGGTPRHHAGGGSPGGPGAPGIGGGHHQKGSSGSRSPGDRASPTAHKTRPSATGAGTASASTGDGGGTPAVLIVLAVLAGLAVLTALAYGISRRLGWEPGWLPGARHATGEAGYRAGGTWGNFRDWLRAGH